MAWQKNKSRMILGVLAIAVTCSAQAQITKCIDARGTVTYTDAVEGNCRNAVVMDIRETTPAVASVATTAATDDAQPVRSAMLFMTGVDMPVAHRSSWASLPSRPRVSSDAQTVSMARQALSETDRALASMRTQKIASSR